MKEDIDILLNRREELLEQINKLQEEYGALGRVLIKLHSLLEKDKEENTINKIQKQIDEQTRNGRKKVYIDNQDLALVKGVAIKDGKSYVDANELQSMIDNYER